MRILIDHLRAALISAGKKYNSQFSDITGPRYFVVDSTTDEYPPLANDAELLECIAIELNQILELRKSNGQD